MIELVWPHLYSLTRKSLLYYTEAASSRTTSNYYYNFFEKLYKVYIRLYMHRRRWWCKCKIIIKHVRKEPDLPMHSHPSSLLFMRVQDICVQNATKLYNLLHSSRSQCYLHGWEKSRVAVHALDLLLLIFLCSILYRFLVFFLASWNCSLVRWWMKLFQI